MGYTAPLTVITGDLATAAQYNTYTKDNLIALRAGGIEIASQAALDEVYAASATQLGRRLPKRSVVSTLFETAARFTATVTGSGAVTHSTVGLNLVTGATITSSAASVWRCSFQSAGGGLFTTLPGEFSANFNTSSGTFGTDFQAFIGLGSITVAGAGITWTSNHIGFKLVRAASGTVTLSATQADGTTETASALTTVAADDALDVALRVDSGSVSYWYRKNGGAWSAATTLTTNIPTDATEQNATCCISNAGVATSTLIRVAHATYQR